MNNHYAIFQDKVLVLGIMIGLALLFFLVIYLRVEILLPQFYLLMGGAVVYLYLSFKLRRYLPLRWYYIIRLSGYVALTHLLLMCSKGEESSFYPFYFFAIILAATLYGMRGSLGVTLLVSLSYTSFFIGKEITLLKDEWLEEMTSFWILAVFAGYISQMVLQRERQIDAMSNLNERIIESLNSGLITVNLQGELTSCNRRAGEILDCDIGNMLGKRLPIGASSHLGQLAALVEKNLGNREERASCELAFTTANGYLRRVDVSSGLLKGRQGEAIGAIAMLTDVTKLRKLEEEIRKQDRLSSIGELAASVAHEIRNPLFIIRGSAQTLSKSLRMSPEDREIMEFIISEVDRLNKMITDLLNFAKPMEPKFTQVKIHELIDDAAKVITGEKHITVVKHYCRNELLLMIDPDQIYQALVNIFLNAKEAIKETGIVTISTRLRGITDEEFLIEISDTGCGIPDEVLPKIFDPFFSLKDNGTGLGLAIVYRIIENHNGRITVASKIGSGTTFFVSLLPSIPLIGGGNNGEGNNPNSRRRIAHSAVVG